MLKRLVSPFQGAFRSRQSARFASMDALIQQSIRLVEANKRSSVPWSLDTVHGQPYFIQSSAGSDEKWKSVTGPTNADHSTIVGVKRLAIYSWNIDFMLPYPDSRMRAGIRHLQRLIETQRDNDVANVIFFAECLESDLKLIASDPWVQSNFAITDLDISSWESGHYGTTTLIDRRLSVKDVFRVHYSQTRMERDGLFVDIRSEGGILRLCNTHLESLAFEPAYRPPQMELCARFMKDSSVAGAILAGDLNAIQDFDKTLHSDNHLKDAFLEQGGSESDAEGGHTWGQQAATVLRERFGTSRMDKVYFCGAVRLMSFERFGAGVEIDDEYEKAELVKLGFERPWITDHLGIKAVFDVSNSLADA